MRRDGFDLRESSLKPVSPCELEVGGFGDDTLEEIDCGKEHDSGEARSPEVLRDPGAPTPREVE